MTTIRELKKTLTAELKASGEFEKLVLKLGVQAAKSEISARARKISLAESEFKKAQSLRIRHGLTDQPYVDAMTAKGVRLFGSFENPKRR